MAVYYKGHWCLTLGVYRTDVETAQEAYDERAMHYRIDIKDEERKVVKKIIDMADAVGSAWGAPEDFEIGVETDDGKWHTLPSAQYLTREPQALPPIAQQAIHNLLGSAENLLMGNACSTVGHLYDDVQEGLIALLDMHNIEHPYKIEHMDPDA